MPKIDWYDDDQPRWEPRLRRERLAREARDRRTRLEQMIAVASLPPPSGDLPVKRPLHLIWGVAVRTASEEPESGRG